MPGAPDVVPDRGLRTHIDPTGRMRRDEDLRGVAHLPPDDELLLVAAGQRTRRHLDAGRADVVVPDDLPGVPARPGHVDQPALRVRRLGLVSEHAVLPQRGVQQQALAVAVLGDVPEPGLPAPARVPGADVGTVEAHRTAGGAGTDDRFDQLRLAVAFHARDAEHLAAVDREADVRHDRAPVRRGHPEVAHAQHRHVGDGRLARLRAGQLAADHHRRQLPGGDRGRVVHARDRGTAPDDRDGVGDRQHLVELVRDEDDGQPLAGELAQVAEQLVDLLRYQHGGGLVEDEDAGAAVQHLEDLDPLAVADAEVLHERVRVDVEPVAPGDVADHGGRGRADAVQLLGAEDDVLLDGEVVGEHEVLVHHADAGRDGLLRGVEARQPAVDVHLALVRAEHAVQDLHERGLARTVLAHDGVDRAAPYRQRHVVVGDDTGEALGDPAQLDGRRVGGLTHGSSRVNSTEVIMAAHTAGDNQRGAG